MDDRPSALLSRPSPTRRGLAYGGAFGGAGERAFRPGPETTLSARCRPAESHSALSLLARPIELRDDSVISGYGEAARQLAESDLAEIPQKAYAHGFSPSGISKSSNQRRLSGCDGSWGPAWNAAEAHLRRPWRPPPADASLAWQICPSARRA